MDPWQQSLLHQRLWSGCVPEEMKRMNEPVKKPFAVTLANFERKLAFLICFSCFFLGMTSAKTLKVYSSRNEHLIKPLFEAYEKEMGNKEINN